MCMQISIIALPIVLSLMLLAACSSSAEPLPTPRQTATSTPLPTTTPQPTATPLPLPTPTPVPTVTPTTTGTPVSDAAASSTQLEDERLTIAAAIEAMQNVESFRAEVDAAFTVIQTEASFRMDEETFGTEFPVRFSGDFQLPDRASGKLQLALGLVLLQIDIVTIGEQAYITNPETGVWEQYPLFLTGLPNPYDLVLLPPETSRYSDIRVVKDEIIDGIQTQHIRANLRANVLGGSYDNLFLDVWIGKDDSLTRRLTMAGEADVDEQDTAGLASGALGAADIGGKAEFTMTITYSDFNAPITIEPPIP